MNAYLSDLGPNPPAPTPVGNLSGHARLTRAGAAHLARTAEPHAGESHLLKAAAPAPEPAMWPTLADVPNLNLRKTWGAAAFAEFNRDFASRSSHAGDYPPPSPKIHYDWRRRADLAELEAIDRLEARHAGTLRGPDPDTRPFQERLEAASARCDAAARRCDAALERARASLPSFPDELTEYRTDAYRYATMGRRAGRSALRAALERYAHPAFLVRTTTATAEPGMRIAVRTDLGPRPAPPGLEQCAPRHAAVPLLPAAPPVRLELESRLDAHRRVHGYLWGQWSPLPDPSPDLWQPSLEPRRFPWWTW